MAPSGHDFAGKRKRRRGRAGKSSQRLSREEPSY